MMTTSAMPAAAAPQMTARGTVYLVTGRLITVHLAPHQIVAALDISFKDDLRTTEVEKIAAGLERQIKETNPDVFALFLRPKADSKVA